MTHMRLAAHRFGVPFRMRCLQLVSAAAQLVLQHNSANADALIQHAVAYVTAVQGMVGMLLASVTLCRSVAQGLGNHSACA